MMPLKTLLNTGVIVSFLSLAACGGGGGGGGQDGPDPTIPITTVNYIVDFSSEQVIGTMPAPDAVTATANLSSASGDDITASGSVTVNGTTATSVTINSGFAGENGPVALTLVSAGGGRWDVPGNTELDITELRQLNDTGFYVSVESPAGTLRGQIRTADWAVGIIDLDADSVVGGSSSTGSAKAGFGINPATGLFRVRVTVDGISNIANVAVRTGIAGSNGGVAVQMESSMSDPNVWGSVDVNNPDAGSVLSLEGLDLFALGSLYFSVESAANPGGALRGQITDPDVIDIFDVNMTAAEVVTGGAPITTSAIGAATVTWIESLSRLGVAVNTDTANVVSVGVYQGARGTNGGLLFSLNPDPVVAGNWVFPVSALSAEQSTAFGNGELYVSISSASNAAGELRGQLEEQNGVTATKVIGEDGGVLAITDSNGISMTLTVGEGALFEESVTMSMSTTDLPTFLSSEITPVVAVKLDPSGTSFAAFPELDISGDLGQGAKIAFVANDDGSVIEYRPLLGDDPIAAALATDTARFDVPHFSVAGVAIDSNNCGTDVPVGGSTAEERAINEITAHNAFVACLQMLGSNTAPDSQFIAQQLRMWYDDLRLRIGRPDAQQLNRFSELGEEILRYTDISQQNGQDFPFGSDGATSDLGVVFSNKIRQLDADCQGGNLQSIGDFVRWSHVSLRIFGGRPVSWGKPTVSCLITADISPNAYQAAVVGTGPVTFDPLVTGADGRDLSSSTSLGFYWDQVAGLMQQNGLAIEMDASSVGMRRARLDAALVSFAQRPEASAIIVYDHTGMRQLEADGSATNCPDPDYDGSRQFFFDIPIVSQSTVANSASSVTATFSGSGASGNISVNSVTITVTYDNNTENSLAGTATGSLSFTETGTDPDTGQPFSNSGTLDLGTDSVDSDLFTFNSANGSDAFGCQLNGLVALGGVL